MSRLSHVLTHSHQINCTEYNRKKTQSQKNEEETKIFEQQWKRAGWSGWCRRVSDRETGIEKHMTTKCLCVCACACNCVYTWFAFYLRLAMNKYSYTSAHTTNRIEWNYYHQFIKRGSISAEKQMWPWSIVYSRHTLRNSKRVLRPLISTLSRVCCVS